jgi:hypothetical protein
VEKVCSDDILSPIMFLMMLVLLILLKYLWKLSNVL